MPRKPEKRRSTETKRVAQSPPRLDAPLTQREAAAIRKARRAFERGEYMELEQAKAYYVETRRSGRRM